LDNQSDQAYKKGTGTKNDHHCLIEFCHSPIPPLKKNWLLYLQKFIIPNIFVVVYMLVIQV